MAQRVFNPTIGLEIHCELKTKSKMFCSCPNVPLEENPNSHICPVCTGQPGALPVANFEAIKQVIKAGMALGCELNMQSKFDRKNYFYPDLPKGYQISQYDLPLCKNGKLDIGEKTIRIKRIHLEEDTGKLMHEKDTTLVDFNRAGVPLMELVTEPDIKSGQEAKRFAQELQRIFRYLNIADADMEKGQMRIEVNISVSDTETFGTKVELKNLSSFGVVEKAIDFEIERQTKVIESGEKVIQETRGWDGLKNRTLSQRIKEESSDYRYFPEPDIAVLDLNKFDLQKIREEIDELPMEKRVRFKREFELNDKDIETFVDNRQLSEYFEKICSELRAYAQIEKIESEYLKLVKLAANYVLTDFKALLGNNCEDDASYTITPENFAELIKMIFKETINSKVAKEILPLMFNTGIDPSQIVKEKGLEQTTNLEEIQALAVKVINANPKPVVDYRGGQKNAVMFLVGQLMRESKGRAKPDIAKSILEALLDKTV